MSILWWLLGAVGISGAGIGIAVLLGGGPALLGIAFKALNFAKGLSPRTWLYIGGAVLLIAGVIAHQIVSSNRLKTAYTTGDTAGYNRAQAEDAKVIAAMRARAQTAEANGLRISQEVRTRNDTDNRTINAAAAVIVRSGPGAASCRRVGDSAVSAGTSGRVAASRPADAAMDPVPDRQGTDLIGLPFADAIKFAKEHDLNRAEVLSWREADQRQRAEWEKLRAKP